MKKSFMGFIMGSAMTFMLLECTKSKQMKKFVSQLKNMSK